MLTGYNVRVVFYLKIAELIDLKIDKDNKGGFKTAYVPINLYALIKLSLKKQIK